MLPKLKTIAERLCWARKNKGLSQTELGRQVGVSQGAVEKTENGKTQKPKWLADASTILGVSYQWLSTGEEVSYRQESQNNHNKGNKEFSNMVPVYGYAAGSVDRIAINEGRVVEMRNRSRALEGIDDAYYITVIGDSMEPMMQAGDYLAVNPRMPPMKGRPCIIQFHDGEAVAKIFVSMDETEIKARQLNPAKNLSYPAESVLSVSAVKGIEW